MIGPTEGAAAFIRHVAMKRGLFLIKNQGEEESIAFPHGKIQNIFNRDPFEVSLDIGGFGGA
jgi:hypothetical protein